jgi:hypothetical protein
MHLPRVVPPSAAHLTPSTARVNSLVRELRSIVEAQGPRATIIDLGPERTKRA